MKRLLPLLLLLCAIVLLCACEENHDRSPDETDYTPTSIPTEDGFMNDRIETEKERQRREETSEYFSNRYAEDRHKSDAIVLKANESAYQQLITKTYPEKEFFESIFIRPLLEGTSRFTKTIDMNEELFPAECVRQMNTVGVYTIHMTQEGGLAYCFYSDDPSFRGDSVKWQFSHSIYVKETLKSTDFKFIKPGDSWQKVAKIDPAVNCYLAIIEADPYEGFVTTHMLQDGVLIIGFERKNEEYVVEVTEVFSDYIVSIEDGPVYDCRIRPDDYLWAATKQ